jgi:regulator of replication initiation timing
MSDVLLKAVAQAIAKVEKKLEDQVANVTSKIAEIQPGASPETVAILVDEVKSMYTTLVEETKSAQQSLLDKTNFVEQELRQFIQQEICRVQTTIGDTVTALGGELLSLRPVEARVLEKSNELNNGTLALLDIAVENFNKKLNDSNEYTDEKLDVIVESIQTTKKEVQENLEEILDIQVEYAKLKKELDEIKTVAGYIGRDGLGLDAKQWQQGIHREGTVVQHYLGQYFVSNKDTSAEPGVSDDWARVGTFGMRHMGAFRENVTYEVGDIYAKDFGTFLETTTGTVLLAGRGKQGKQGERGEASTIPGPRGEAGVSIKNVVSGDEGFVLEMTDGSLHTVMYPDEVMTLSKIKAAVDGAVDFESLKSIFANLK